MQNSERQIIRELAKQYMELANSDGQMRANRRMKDSNDLKIVRPPVSKVRLSRGTRFEGHYHRIP